MEWTDLVEHLRGQHQVGHAEGQWIELWRSFRDGNRAIRQHQTVRAVEGHGETYFVIEAEIAAPLRARAALCAGPAPKIGRLLDRGGALVVHTQIPSSAVTHIVIDRLLVAVAREAIRLSMVVWQQQVVAHQAAQSAPQPAAHVAAQHAVPRPQPRAPQAAPAAGPVQTARSSPSGPRRVPQATPGPQPVRARASRTLPGFWPATRLGSQPGVVRPNAAPAPTSARTAEQLTAPPLAASHLAPSRPPAPAQQIQPPASTRSPS
jgi:hypothetical protein